MTADVLTLPTKRCPALGHVGERMLPLSSFHRCSSAPDGRQSYCIACDRVRAAKRSKQVAADAPAVPFRNARTVEPSNDQDLAEGAEAEERSELFARGSLSRTDLEEVDRFTDRALELALGGMPWPQAWSLANAEDTSALGEDAATWARKAATKILASPNRAEMLFALADGKQVEAKEAPPPPLVTPPERLRPVREAQVEHFAKAGEQPARAGHRDAFQDAAAILNEPEDVDALVDEPEDFEGARSPTAGTLAVGTRGGPGKRAMASTSSEARTARSGVASPERRGHDRGSKPGDAPRPDNGPSARSRPAEAPKSRALSLDSALLAELARRGWCQPYDLSGDGPLDVGLDVIRAALERLIGRGLVEGHGRGRVVLYRLVPRDIAKGAPS